MAFKTYVEMAIACRWTIRNIRGLFGVSSAVAADIQATFDADKAIAISKAANELCNGQIGF
jgi:hypothetical protein